MNGREALFIILFGFAWAEIPSDCVCKNGTNLPEAVGMECKCQGVRSVPGNLPKNLARLTLVEAPLENLTSRDLKPYKSLQDLTLSNLEHFEKIDEDAFRGLPLLRTIYLYHLPRLKRVSKTLFNTSLPKLKILRIVHTGLTDVPFLHNLKTENPLHMIDLDNNRIRELPPNSIRVKTEQLTLNYNNIVEVKRKALYHSQIAKLSLKGNRHLRNLHEEAFVGVTSLRYLDLSYASFQYLPTKGLEELEILKIQHVHAMKTFPSVYNFKLIQEAWLTYPYHCCAFHYPKTHDPSQYENHRKQLKIMLENCGNITDKSSKSMEKESDALWWTDDSWSWHETSYSDREEIFHNINISIERDDVTCGSISKNYEAVRCYPEPDAFNPCEDLMGNWTLRVAVWFVAGAAIVGNVAVLAVLLSSAFRMTVPKFLMCNLAFADLCMGLYLAMIAVVDARSIGDYFNHAIYWQRGIGCKLAGFLTVFSCVLSVFTLMLITSERWYTITYAIHLNKRIRLGAAVKIMICGWIFSCVLAVLPIIGVSGYSKTSLCLPMDNASVVDNAYLLILLLFDASAFCIICACYARMYTSVRGGGQQARVASAACRSDATVAKRMALLVIVDFACWAPVAFFGLTALFGHPLIDIPGLKIILVFFYPLNSCANPYLYALLTQQYRRDLFIILGRYGICVRKADAYKGTSIGMKRRSIVAGVAAKLENDCVDSQRGSILTTLTSLDSAAKPSYRTNQIEMYPLNPPRQNHANLKSTF